MNMIRKETLKSKTFWSAVAWGVFNVATIVVDIPAETYNIINTILLATFGASGADRMTKAIEAGKAK